MTLIALIGARISLGPDNFKRCIKFQILRYPDIQISIIFLIYINDLADNLVSDVRLFADDTSSFTIVYDETVLAQVFNSDLKTIEEWEYQWKMQFSSDVKKQAVKVIFSQKKSKPFHPLLSFDGSLAPISDVHKHLGFFLDSESNFLRHVKEAITKERKGMVSFVLWPNMLRVMYLVRCTNFMSDPI